MTPLQQINQAIHYLKQGNYQKAQGICENLHMPASLQESEMLLAVALEIAKHTGDSSEALKRLDQLIAMTPGKMHFVMQKADLLQGMGRIDEAMACYRAYLQANPRHADAQFNFAWFCRKNQHLDLALRHYQEALSLEISGPEEVHVNMAAILSELRDEEQAKAHLLNALSINPSYVPALFNLATLYEEFGDKEAAQDLYQQILRLEPSNIEVMARLINMHKVVMGESLLDQLKACLETKQGLPQIQQEAGYFALGKAFDDLAQYDKAFAYYQHANRLCQKRLPLYQAAKTEKYTAAIANYFDQDWFSLPPTSQAFSPIFICGMFRSGTSLTEQILAAHSRVTSGGELTLVRNMVRDMPVFPPVQRLSVSKLDALAHHYRTQIESRFPDAKRVTDKRPDNFFYVGLLKRMFPRAKFICTWRHPLDTCLSVYFQHLGNDIPYGSSLMDTAHYYTQYHKLLMHWQALLPHDVLVMDYDKLVQDPETEIRRLLAFCDLEWEPACLAFNQVRNAVKTASVWQVRQGIYQRSSERWKHYHPHLAEVAAFVSAAGL